MTDKKAFLEPDKTYHFYNRANGAEKLFLSDDNYCFFLKKYDQYVHSIADTYCYCLMPNHFHFLIRIKSEEELEKIFAEKIEKKIRATNLTSFKAPNLQGFKNLGGFISQLISKQFSNFFNSYTKAFNKQHQRSGSLFSQNFNRKEVKDEIYLRKLIHYIHYNPIKAGLSKQYDWKYSSYPTIVSTQKTKVLREEVIALFDTTENFIYCHKHPPKITGIE